MDVDFAAWQEQDPFPRVKNGRDLDIIGDVGKRLLVAAGIGKRLQMKRLTCF